MLWTLMHVRNIDVGMLGFFKIPDPEPDACSGRFRDEG